MGQDKARGLRKEQQDTGDKTWETKTERWALTSAEGRLIQKSTK